MNLFIIFVLEAGKLSLSILTLVIFGAKVQTILLKKVAIMAAYCYNTDSREARI